MTTKREAQERMHWVANRWRRRKKLNVSDNLPVRATLSSTNAKIGIVHATYVSLQSCPTGCALRGNGCYAENGPMMWHDRRMSEHVEQFTLFELAQLEADFIDALPGWYPLRVHVEGDSATTAAATLVGDAMVRYTERTGQPAWTYTHAWRLVPREAWGEAKVWASCETALDVEHARMRGYDDVAIVVPEFPTDRRFERDGIEVVPCPEQSGRADNCLACGLCLRAKNVAGAIGFRAHGARVKRVQEVINARA